MPFDPAWRGEAETQILRRVITPDSSDSAASPDSPPERPTRAWSPTPVPPPAPPKPVLPQPTASLQASAGRRFSASASPSEFSSAAPRRSATSVSSPPSADFYRPATAPTVEFEPATPVGGGTPPPSPPQPPEADTAAAGAQPAPGKRGRGRAFGVLGIVAAIAAGVTGAVWLSNLPQATPTPSPASTTPASLEPTLTTADLASLGGSTWSPASSTIPAGDTPICLTPDATMPTADRSTRDLLSSDADSTSYVLHIVDTYADTAAAANAYQARLQQAGTCADTVALIANSSTVSGLADAAFASQIEAQEDPTRHHALLVSRTGRNVSMVDVVSEERIEVADVAGAVAKPLARLCSGGEGACPGRISLSASVPAAGQHPGWLIEADLPRITAGAGRWGQTAPSPTLTVMGSQCEAVGLTKVADTTASAQRTLLLADDPVVPAGFGIDQVVYTFTDEKAAKSFADKLTSSLAGCPDRVPTASVDKGPTVKGAGQGGAAFSGKAYLVTQKTANDSVRYRVAVVRVGKRVSYLLANPSAEVDFTDAQWKAIMTRTGQRVSQMP